jgi:Arc/MetJ-type ribon-helix-helix transcriptional regulator
MKRKLSISVDENLLKSIDELVETGKFRNKSHVVEYTLNNFMEYENGKRQNN